MDNGNPAEREPARSTVTGGPRTDDPEAAAQTESVPRPTTAHPHPSRICSYRDLVVWQEAMDLGVGVYELTRRLPTDERFGLTAQLRRTAVSVPSNIAEGWGRGSTREYVQFIRYARGSLKELETQWELAARVGYFEARDLDPLEERSERLGKMLLALLRALAKRA